GPARAVRGRSVRLSHAQGNGPQDLPRLLEADRRQAGGTGMVFRSILRARSLWLRLLHLGRPPRAADGGAQALHRVQGPHAQASRRQTRGGGREDQGLIGASVLLGCVSCLTFGPADALYGGDVTERSVMAVGLLPPPLLGVSSLDWAPLAAAGGAFFHRGRLTAAEKEARRLWAGAPEQVGNPRLSREDWGRRAPFSNGSGFPR